jgi:3-oxoacyl-[acyl-carrier-protein] synthase-1
MAIEAIQECLAAASPEAPADTALALCVAELSRPGRPARLDDRFFANICSGIRGAERLGPHRRLFSSGSVGGVEALQWAEHLLSEGAAEHCIVAGVDSYLQGGTLQAYHALKRLRTAKNADGFAPGEAAAAVLLSTRGAAPVAIECRGVGWGRERAIQDSELPLRGDGLAMAYRAAFKDAGCGFPDVDYRLADIAGDQYGFKEAALGVLRTLRIQKESFYLWTPADCIGRVGAASVPLALGIALAAASRRYSPGPGALCHFTDDAGVRAAAVLRERDRRAPAGN